MTLIWELSVGLGILLIISAWEDLSLTCSFNWVLNGAAKGKFPSGCSKLPPPKASS